MWLFFALATTLLWGAAELFYKKGARPDEKYSHLKITVCVGAVMGIHAIFTLLTQDIGYNPINIIYYLPVSLLYILSMAFSYFGMRFVEESISDPIENTGGALCTLLCVIFLGYTITDFSAISIVIIVIGILGIGFVENRGDTKRKRALGKKMAIIAFCMPFIYAILDAVAMVIDEIYLDIEATHLVNVTEDTLENVANTSYELTFAVFALALFVFMKIKKVNFFGAPLVQTVTEGDMQTPAKRINFKTILEQKDKIIAAVFETAGQLTYVYALSSDDNSAVAETIISAVCVVSLLLSRIFLKEKLGKKQYLFIGIVILGILLLAVSEEFGIQIF